MLAKQPKTQSYICLGSYTGDQLLNMYDILPPRLTLEEEVWHGAKRKVKCLLRALNVLAETKKADFVMVQWLPSI